MLKSAIPAKFNIPFGQSAVPADITYPIPQPSQIGITNGRASLTDGFPPDCFLQAGAGGVSPFGADFNGLLFQSTSWDQWFSAGGPVSWDSAFSAAIGGYPAGAVVQSSTTSGLWWYSQADNNTSNPDTGGANWLGFQMTQTVPAGRGEFELSSGTACTLAPVNGGLIWINGLNYQIPQTGVNFSNGSLSANTLYYAYVRIAGGVLTGDFSTTGYADASNGVPQKIGDATRSLVGMVYTNGAAQFINQDGTLTVRSFYGGFINGNIIRSRTSFSADRSVTASTFAEINTEIRNSFLVWNGENVEFITTGSFSATGNGVATQISFDGAAGEQESCAVAITSVSYGLIRGPCSIMGVKTGLAEGLHYATLLGAVPNGTGTWNSSNTNATSKTSIIIKLQ